jgi:hypothetical protein
MLGFIEATMFGDPTFGPERQAAIRKDIEEIRDYRCPNTGGHGTCYYNLSEAVVDWCIQHPELIARQEDPKLKL